MRWIADDWLSLFVVSPFLPLVFRVWLSVDETTEKGVCNYPSVYLSSHCSPRSVVLARVFGPSRRLWSLVFIHNWWSIACELKKSSTSSNDPLSSKTQTRSDPILRFATQLTIISNQLRLGENFVLLGWFIFCLISRSQDQLEKAGRYLHMNSGVCI